MRDQTFGINAPPTGNLFSTKTWPSLTQPEPVGELGSEGYSVATTASPGVAVTTEGYKRKMEDQDGSRAAKNPRSSSPTFASLEVCVLIFDLIKQGKTRVIHESSSM